MYSKEQIDSFDRILGAIESRNFSKGALVNYLTKGLDRGSSEYMEYSRSIKNDLAILHELSYVSDPTPPKIIRLLNNGILATQGNGFLSTIPNEVKGQEIGFTLSEKVKLIDTAIIKLAESHGMIPELLDGFQKFPSYNSDLDRKYRIIENELISLGLAEKIGGGDNSTPNGYLRLKITPYGQEFYLSKRSSAQLFSQNTDNKGKTSDTMLDIFISHSSKDKEVANRLIRVLRSSMNLPAEKIRCTSVPGYKLEGGVNTDERLKHEVTTCRILIGILSEQSLESMYVLFELGARWGQNLTFKPIIFSPSHLNKVSGPLHNLHIINVSNQSEVYQLLEEISIILKLALTNPSVLNDDVRYLLDHIESLQTADSSLVTSFVVDSRPPDSFFTDEQRTLLLEASRDSAGRISIIRTQDGYSIQTNNKSFCNTYEGRIRATWEGAITSLEEEGLIESQNFESTIFTLTQKGYKAADEI